MSGLGASGLLTGEDESEAEDIREEEEGSKPNAHIDYKNGHMLVLDGETLTVTASLLSIILLSSLTLIHFSDHLSLFIIFSSLFLS